MRKRVIGLIIVILILTLIFLPMNSTAKVKKTDEAVTIKESKRHRVEIDTTGGEVNYTWNIQNSVRNLTVDFTISQDDELITSPKPLSQKSDILPLNPGVYTFEWLNSNNISINLTYYINYPHEEVEESTGCYSTAVFTLILVMGVASYVVFKKK